MSRGHSLARALLCIGCLAAGAVRAEVVFQDALDRDPLAGGWTDWTPGDAADRPRWEAADAHTGERALAVTKGRWVSPFFPVAPGGYYLAEAYTRAGGIGYFHSWFYEAGATDRPDGAGPPEIIGGVCGQVFASAGWEKNSLLFQAPRGVGRAKVAFEPRNGLAMAIDDVTVRRVTTGEAAAFLAGIRTTLPPFTETVRCDRWEALPRTRAALTAGGPLRIVLLGSSNINDIFGGYFDLALHARHPAAVIDCLASVRPGTGCTFYQEPENLQRDALDLHPDLLLIECSEFGSTVEAIRRVASRVRQACGADILLVTQGAYREAWLDPPDPGGGDFRAGLFRMAAEEKAPVLDLGRAYSRYVARSGKPADWFLRDRHHLNDRGKQAMAHFLAEYLTPGAAPR